MAFYCPWKLYGNHSLKLRGEVIENNIPTVISRETRGDDRAWGVGVLCFYLFMRMFDSTVSGLGEGRRLCHLQSCDFLFMCLAGSGPRHNGSLQSPVSDTQTHGGSDYFGLHSHPVAMNNRCLWTCATARSIWSRRSPPAVAAKDAGPWESASHWFYNTCHLKRRGSK